MDVSARHQIGDASPNEPPDGEQALVTEPWPSVMDDSGRGQHVLLPVDPLKIDRSVVAGLAIDAADAGHRANDDRPRSSAWNRGCRGWLANAAPLESLTSMGASSAQGFHISCPMPADALLLRLQTNALRLPAGQPLALPPPARGRRLLNRDPC
jgi:hypothetical protein